MQRLDANSDPLGPLDSKLATPEITSTEIKQELVDYYEELHMDAKTKCGEIFAYCSGDFVLVCGFCDQQFDEMVLFGEHVRVDHGCDAKLQRHLLELSSPPRTKEEPLYLLGGNTENMACDISTEKSVVDKQISKQTDFPISFIECSKQFKRKYCLKRRHLNSESSTEDSYEFSTSIKMPKVQRMLDSEYSQHLNEQDREVKDIWIENEQELVQNCSNRFSEDPTPSIDRCGSGIDNDTDESHNANENKGADGSYGKSFYESYEITKKLFSCDICGRIYKTKNSLNRHKQKHHNPNDSTNSERSDLLCIFCNKQMSSKKIFHQHMKTHNMSMPNNGSNEHDPDLTMKRSSSDETEVDSDASPNHCDICNKYFKTKYNLIAHSDNHDKLPSSLQSDESFLKCKFCNIQFKKYAERKTHEIIHVGNRPYECPHCSKRFPSNYDRKLHIRTHTGDNLYVCSHCPKVCTNGTDLKRHVDRHLNIRNFGCELCEKRFYRRFELARHMRTHTKERPYVCEDCGATYPVLAQLKDHQLRHTGVKNVKCEICGRLFYSKSVLKVHMPTHFAEKPFECDVCGRKFSRAKAMQKHMKLHSGIKPYVCNICGKAYAQDSGLYAHKKSHGASKI